MEKENFPELSLDLSKILEHLNSLNEDYEKIRYLRQYTHLLAVYAEHEPYKVESLLSKLPNVFQEEVWDFYIQENDVIEKTKDGSEKNDNEKQNVIKKRWLQGYNDKLEKLFYKRLKNEIGDFKMDNLQADDGKDIYGLFQKSYAPIGLHVDSGFNFEDQIYRPVSYTHLTLPTNREV